MKLADIVKTKRPDQIPKSTNFKPLEFIEQLCNQHELLYYCADDTIASRWYFIVEKYYGGDNKKLINLLKILMSNWCEVSRYLQLLFNKDSKNIISSIENTRFNVSIFFKYFEHLKALGEYLELHSDYDLFDPLDIFSHTCRALPAHNFYRYVLDRATPDVVTKLYSSFGKLSPFYFMGLIKSPKLWSSLKGGNVLRSTWCEFSERFDLLGKPIKLPWQQPDNWSKLGDGPQIIRDLFKTGFSMPKAMAEEPPIDELNIALILLESLNTHNLIFAVSSRFDLFLMAENLIGTIFTLTTKKPATLLSADQIQVFKRMLPSDKDVMIGQAMNPLDYPFTAGLTVIPNLESDFMFKDDSDYVGKVILNRLKFNKPTIILYGRSQTNRLTDIILFKELAKKYPPAIAETIAKKAEIMLIEPRSNK